MAESKQKYAPLSDATRAKLAQYEALMGKRPDGEIARAAGLDRRYVVVYRYYAGIPPYQRTARDEVDATSAGTRRISFRRSRLDGYRHLMGEVPDGRIAELAGCSREAVMRYRSRHEISPATRGAAAPPPAAEAPSTLEAPTTVQTVIPEPPATRARPAADPSQEDLPPEVDEVLAIEPALASVVVLERAPAAGGTARNGYLVTAQIEGEQKTYLVVGSDIALAARQALHLLGRLSPSASILELSFHAEML